MLCQTTVATCDPAPAAIPVRQGAAGRYSQPSPGQRDRGWLSDAQYLGQEEPCIDSSKPALDAMGEGFARCFTASEQLSSVVAHGCLCGSVLSIGGFPAGNSREVAGNPGETLPLWPHCDGSWRRTHGTLPARSRQKREEIAESGGEVPAVCHFHRLRQVFAQSDLVELAKETMGEGFDGLY